MNAQHTSPGPNSPAPLLRLHLFGGFRATRDGGPALAERWPRPSARALVKLLAVTPGHSLHREQAMDICWPDADAQAATGSLRVALHAARRALEPELAPRAASSYLISDGAMLRLDPATVWIDADHAEEAALAALGSGDVDRFETALREFDGELLPEDRYATWAQPRRDRLAALREELLLGLAAAHLERGAAQEAAAVAEQVLAASPAEETAHQILIDAYIRQGLRRRAVRQYHVCREALDAELGVRPGPETEALHRAALAAEPAPLPSAPSLPAPLRAPAASPLRGRDNVLRRLTAAGGPPVTLLTGEAGVGKTRLVGEVARRAAEAGSAVLWGGGHDAEGHTPYGAFAEALDGWLAGREAGERARVGAEHPELAAFLPSLGQSAGGRGGRSPEEERDRLFRATAALLGELAAAHPVLLVLDDLHAADTGSFQLLSHLARRAAATGVRLRFLVTWREEELPDGDPRRAGLASLTRHRLAVREELRRLDREACLAVARDVGAAGHRVWELSLGNPLFAVELARGPAEGEAPDGIRELVAERLGRLDQDARRIVEALSAAGSEAALSELLDVAAHGLRPAVDGAAATDALERAIGAALVEERQVVVAGRPEAGLAFRHPLVRLTCYEQLTAVRRRQLHAAFAKAVLHRRPDAVDALASHFARADDPRAAEYLRRAAERAAALYANDTADRYYRDLVARLDVDAARARLAHSQVLRRMGHFGQAAEVLRLALGEFERRGEHDDAVLAAARLAETLVKTGAHPSAAEVLRNHPPTDRTAPEPTATHHVAWAVTHFVSGHYDRGYAAARTALGSARQVGGVAGHGLVARAFAQQAANLGLAGRFGEAREAADRALAPAEAYGDPTLLGGVLSTLRENARRGGRLRDAVDFGQRALDLAEQSGDPTAAVFERANLAELRLLLDELDAARTLAEAAVAGAASDGAWCLPYALAALARVLMRTDACGQAPPLLDRADREAVARGDHQARHEVRTARAELALRETRPELVRPLLAGDEAPTLVAWAELLSGERESARRTAAAEALRAERAGERLAEVEARVVLAVCLTGDAARLALAEAEELAAALPYPAGLRQAGDARRLLAAE
ncbi:AAA family ATPase [Streptomyces sp. AcE210]|uniref:ATP-binding protein n=1 Tax=Streptomyces sp. AcE210 TaxID=2292703 RepID=UPI000E30B3A6|nr:AAA family ATPase [Streptomyces sp. AcE210]RFC76020.1 transcriptional regulator [Streptomyces sp. AcE210]